LNKYGTLSPSYAECNKKNISAIGKLCLKLFSILKIIHIEEKIDGNIKCNNLTLINLCLLYFGPTNEKALTIILLIIQVRFKLYCDIFIIFIKFIFYFLDCLQLVGICYTLSFSIIIL